MSEQRDYTFYIKQKCLKTVFLNNQLEKQAYRNGCDDAVVFESGSGASNASSSYSKLLLGATITSPAELETALLTSSCPDPTAPDAPLDAEAVAGNEEVTVTFSAPASDGGSAITGYRATASPGGAFVEGEASPLTITGLTNGVTYTVEVVAVNGIGASEAAVAGPVTPVAPGPSEGVLLAKFDPVNVSGSSITTTGAIAITGTLAAGVTYNAGEGGGAFYFNGTTSFISFPQTNFGGIITVCAWVKPETKASINAIIANTTANTFSAGFKFGWNGWNTSNQRMFFEGGNGSAGWSRVSDTDSLVTMGQWQHLTYVLDTVGRTITFYYNGILQGVASGAADVQANIDMNRAFNIGAFTDNSYKMKGFMGEFYLYNYALSAGEIQTSYNGTRARYEAI